MDRISVKQTTWLTAMRLGSKIEFHKSMEKVPKPWRATYQQTHTQTQSNHCSYLITNFTEWRPKQQPVPFQK